MYQSIEFVHEFPLATGLVVFMLMALWIRQLVKRKLRVRPTTKRQRAHLRQAKRLYRKVKYSKMTTGELLDWIAQKGSVNGYVFELFVILVLSRALKLKYVGDIKLSGDAGLDGVLVSDTHVYFIQSKYYSNYLTSVTLTELAKKALSFKNRSASNNWHKVLGIPKCYSRNLELEVSAVVATTGKLSEANIQRAQVSDICLLDWPLLVSLVRKDVKRQTQKTNGLRVVKSLLNLLTLKGR